MQLIIYALRRDYPRGIYHLALYTQWLADNLESLANCQKITQPKRKGFMNTRPRLVRVFWF